MSWDRTGRSNLSFLLLLVLLLFLQGNEQEQTFCEDNTVFSKTRCRAVAMGLLVAPLLVCVGLVGCRKTGPVGNTISGKVTYKGAPVANGNIKFFTKDNQGFREVYAGILKQDGRFSFSGVPAVGQVVVTVTPAFDPLADMAEKFKGTKEMDEGLTKMKEAMAKNKGDASQRVATSVPTKYNAPSTTDLTWEIKEGANTKDFDLQ